VTTPSHPMVARLVDLESPYDSQARRPYRPGELVRFALGASGYWADLALAWLEQGLSTRGLEHDLAALAADRGRAQGLRHRAARMARTLTDADLEAIDAGAEAALPGPWESLVEGRDHVAGSDFIRTGGLDDSAPDLYVTRSSADWSGEAAVDTPTLDFVAASRQDVPRLVAEVRRLRRAVGERDI
jgi:hypothetical protein